MIILRIQKLKPDFVVHGDDLNMEYKKLSQSNQRIKKME